MLVGELHPPARPVLELASAEACLTLARGGGGGGGELGESCPPLALAAEGRKEGSKQGGRPEVA